MRIGIDISPALAPASGMRRYVELLLDGLVRVGPEHDYFLCASFWGGFPDRLRQLRLPQAKNVHLVLWRFPQRVLLPTEHFLKVPLQEMRLRPLKLDVFHGVGNLLPRLRSLRSVVTVHHVGGVLDSASWWDRFYFEMQTAATLKAARCIIGISEFTRQEIIRRYGVSPERVVRVYSGGADPIFRPAASDRSTPGASPSVDILSLGARRPYILFVSPIRRRKNLETLARAFALLKGRGEGKNLQLVLVGDRGSYFSELWDLLATLGVQGDVRCLENMSQEQLAALYQSAEIFAYPSKLEGFGLPVLEAMACGTPVVAARASALPEVVGDAGLLLPPDSPEAFADAFGRLLRDPGFSRELREKGFRRASEFSWNETARGTLEAYRRVCS